MEKGTEPIAGDLRAEREDTDLFNEDDEPSEFAEEKLEPIDDNLVCPICLDLLFNPICTTGGHTFCKACLAETFQKCPLCNEPGIVSGSSINITLRHVLEKTYPKRTNKRKYYHDIRQKQLDEEMKEKDYLTDVPVFFVMGHFTPGGVDFLRIFEKRYHDMINLVLQGNKRFVIIRRRAEHLGYVVKIEEYRRLMDNRTIIKIKSLERFKAEEYYIPENRQGLYPEDQEQLWYTKGPVLRDEYPEFEDAKEREAYLTDVKGKANQVQKLVFEQIEQRQNKISRRNLGWIQIRYKFPSVVSSKSVEEYITKVGTTALNFFYYGGESNEVKGDLIFNGTPKERIEFCLQKLKDTPYKQKLFWFEEDEQAKKGWKGLVVLLFFVIALGFFKYLQ